MVAPFNPAAWLDAETNRRRFDEYTLPRYREIELPESYGGLTGMLPGDYRGPYAGLPTFGALSGAASLFGQVGDFDDGEIDPRLAAMGYRSGQRTLGGRELDHRGDVQRFAERRWNEEFAADRADRDRSFREGERTNINADRARDTQLELETGVPYFNGSPMPAWLRPHAEWARDYATGNQGRMPKFEEMAAALGQHGHRPEDFNQEAPGQPFPGTLPTAAPGVIIDPARGGFFDAVSGKSLTGPEVGDVARNRMASGVRISGFSDDGTPIYAAPAGTQMADQAGLGPGSGDARAPGMMSNMTTGITGGGAAPRRGLLGSGATAAAARSSTPKSFDQRRLEEEGRRFDAGYELDRMRTEAEVARMNGQEARADELERRAMALEEQVQTGRLNLDAGLGRGRLELDTEMGRGRLGLDRDRLSFDKGQAIGEVDGRSTLDKQTLYGRGDDGRSTMAREELYGGEALANGGLTLGAQRDLGYIGGRATLAREGQEADTALRALDQASRLRADPFQMEAYKRGLGAGGISNAIHAVAGRGQLAVGGSAGQAPGVPNLEQFARPTTGPTFGRQPSWGRPMSQAQTAGGPAGQTPVAAPGPSDTPAPAAGAQTPAMAMATNGRPASIEQQAAATPELNQIAGRQYRRLDRGGQRMVNSAMKFAGRAADDDEIEDAVQRSMPGQGRRWRTPTFGRVA